MKSMNVPTGDVTKMPVIGRILVGGLTFTQRFGDDTKEITMPDEWEDVVAIVTDEQGYTIYVLNKWYKPHVPQIRIKEVIKEFIPAQEI